MALRRHRGTGSRKGMGSRATGSRGMRSLLRLRSMRLRPPRARSTATRPRSTSRWRVNEAFSSRFCAGLMNLSPMYVPLISLVYANVRGIQKLFGK